MKKMEWYEVAQMVVAFLRVLKELQKDEGAQKDIAVNIAGVIADEMPGMPKKVKNAYGKLSPAGAAMLPEIIVKVYDWMKTDE